MTFLAVGSIGILIVLILFFSFSTALMKSTNTFLKMYLLIVSIIAIIGATISFGFFTYASLEVALISHEEFAKNNWQYTSCSNANYEYDPKTWDPTSKEKTEEEISACQQEALVNLEKSRSYEYKDTLIVSLTRFFVFAILFLTHFPFFIKQNRETN